ncbi:Uncharacterised protein [Mycobacteroides abscessus subsp. abscessus]|uniref:hypothetical protein n=1 Tax=Mycobacteroides abscessus TaxID=36809 RepID=UPI00092B71DB|nr:hypothetical protein [Mycobacteroides abscessus]SHP85378.1 Uncharacterised protein [Mycobacteroides abscessus subsp. abscessus]
MTTARYDPHEHTDYLDVDECAARMQLTTTDVLDLVQRRVLRAVSLGDGLLLVQPAIVSGATA